MATSSNEADNDISDSNQFEAIPFLLFALKKWYLIILCTLMGFLGAKLILRYAVPMYTASTRLVLNERQENDPLDEIIGRRGLGFKEKSRIENDLEKISSRDIAERAVKKLNQTVSYYHVGRVKGFVETDRTLSNTEIKLNYAKQSLFGKIIELKINDEFAEVRLPEFEIEDLLELGTIADDFNKEGKLILSKKGSVYFKDSVLSFSIVKRKTSNPIVYIKLNTFDMVVDRLKSSLEVKREGDQTSTLVSVTSTLNVPELAKRYVDSLSLAYIEYDREEQIRTIENAIKFINQEVERLGDSLESIDSSRINIHRTNEVLNLEVESQNLASKLNQLIEKQQIVSFKLLYTARVSKSTEDVENLRTYQPPMIVGIDDPVFNLRLEEITSSYQELAKRLEGINDQHPIYPELKIEFAEKAARLKQTLNNLQVQLQMELDDINARISEVKAKFRKQPKLLSDIANLDRNYHLNNSLFTLLLEKKIESGIQLASVVSDHHVLSYASKSKKIFPKDAKMLGTGVALGLIFPLLVLFLLFYFDKRIKSISHISSHTNVPFIGAIPKVDDFGPAFIYNYPKSLLSESLRALKNNVNYLIERDQTPVILITSSRSGEGKTFTAENLGAIFAYANKKTIIVGADLRRPKLFSEFNIAKKKGLSEYLAGQAQFDEIITDTGFKNLHIIGAGANPPNPAELLERSAFPQLLDHLKSLYDFVIIDSPPYQVVTDTEIIARHVDAVLFVMRHNYTKRDVIERMDGISGDKLPNLGIILNVFESKIAYGYRYSAYAKNNDYGYRGYYGRVPGDGLYVESSTKKKKGIFSVFRGKS